MLIDGSTRVIEIKKYSHVRISRTASLAWLHLKWVLTIPVWLVAIRETAMKRSRSDSHQAVDAFAGKNIQSRTPHAIESILIGQSWPSQMKEQKVTCPTMRNKSCHRDSKSVSG